MKGSRDKQQGWKRGGGVRKEERQEGGRKGGREGERGREIARVGGEEARVGGTERGREDERGRASGGRERNRGVCAEATLGLSWGELIGDGR